MELRAPPIYHPRVFALVGMKRQMVARMVVEMNHTASRWYGRRALQKRGRGMLPHDTMPSWDTVHPDAIDGAFVGSSVADVLEGGRS